MPTLGHGLSSDALGQICQLPALPPPQSPHPMAACSCWGYNHVGAKPSHHIAKAPTGP